jgi:hypothetical protein
MSKPTNNEDNSLPVFLMWAVILVIWLAVIVYDVSELTHHVDIAILQDKFRSEDCSSSSDEDGNLSVFCDTNYHFLLASPNLGRKDDLVSREVFEEFVPGSNIQRDWDTGRLGIEHNQAYSTPKISPPIAL